MNTVVPRKQLGLIDYNNIPANYVYIGRLPSPFSDLNDNYENIADFFVGSGYLIYREEGRQNGILNSAKYQFEMPLAGVRWMIDAIELGFEIPPSAGGLEKNKLHTDVTINDERLRIMYGVCVGGEGVGGYTIKNSSRSSYILPEASQQFSITVEFGIRWEGNFLKIF